MSLIFHIAICIIILAIFIAAMYYYYDTDHTNKCSDIINGFWTASNDFCTASDIDLMSIYFTGVNDINPVCYIVIKDNDDIVENHLTNIDISRNDYNKYTLKFAETPQTLPQKITIDVDEKTNKMILRDSDIIYGILFKDHENSELITANEC